MMKSKTEAPTGTKIAMSTCDEIPSFPTIKNCSIENINIGVMNQFEDKLYKSEVGHALLYKKQSRICNQMLRIDAGYNKLSF
mgnify:CR=1 FL=1